MCIQVDLPEVPGIGGGISLEPPALPQFSGQLGICCKTVSYTTPTLPPLFPPLFFNAAVGLAIGGALDTIQAFLDSLPPKCPLE